HPLGNLDRQEARLECPRDPHRGPESVDPIAPSNLTGTGWSRRALCLGQVAPSLLRLTSQLLQFGSAGLQRCIFFLERSHFPLQRGLFRKRGSIHLLQVTRRFHPSVDSDSPLWRQAPSSDRVNWSQSQRQSPDWCCPGYQNAPVTWGVTINQRLSSNERLFDLIVVWQHRRNEMG